jgi:hypothetical protein
VALAAALGFIAVLAGPASAATAASDQDAASVVIFQFDRTSVPAKVFSVAAGVPTGNVYCTDQYRKPKCLKSLTGQVNYLGCGAVSGGGDVNTVVRNPNTVSAPRDIAVFFNGEEFFGDRDLAPPGKSVIKYRGLPDGDYILLVGWDDQGLIFYGLRFTVACAG